jgi:L-fucose mutarotase/ribose pyranase (RbsD/FucU family)
MICDIIDDILDFLPTLTWLCSVLPCVPKIERFAFYERARQAFAVVQTGETRLYGCVLLKMGVVRPA